MVVIVNTAVEARNILKITILERDYRFFAAFFFVNQKWIWILLIESQCKCFFEQL